MSKLASITNIFHSDRMSNINVSNLSIHDILNLVKKNPSLVKYHNCNMKFVMDCINKDPIFYFTLGDEWKKSEFIISHLLRRDINSFKYLSPELKSNFNVNKIALVNFYPFIKKLPRYQDLINNVECCKIIIRCNPSYLLSLPERIYSNVELSLYLTELDVTNVRYVPWKFRNNLQFMIPIVAKNGICFKYASGKLRRNINLALLAIKSDHNAFRYVPEEYKTDPYFLNEAKMANPMIEKIDCIPTQQVDNTEIKIPKIPMFPVQNKDFLLKRSYPCFY